MDLKQTYVLHQVRNETKINLFYIRVSVREQVIFHNMPFFFLPIYIFSPFSFFTDRCMFFLYCTCTETPSFGQKAQAEQQGTK